MRQRVLFVDDDHRLTAMYAEGVQSRDLDERRIHNVDDALEYLKRGEPADVIVWDMMMAPGRAFAEVDTKGGLATGRFLYREMRRLKPGAAFVLLTNQQADYDDFDRESERSYVRYKPDTSPEDLAEHIIEILSPDAGGRRGD